MLPGTNNALRYTVYGMYGKRIKLSIRIHTHTLMANNEVAPTIDLHFLVDDTYKHTLKYIS